MTTKEFIQSLENIVNAKIFITNKIDLLEKETANNHWTISIDQELAEQLRVEDLTNVITQVKANRQKQLRSSAIEIDLIFYLWFDEQASQLRFNLINSNHQKLPFSALIKLVRSEKKIITAFLKSEFHNGIPINEFIGLEKFEIEGINEVDRMPFEIKVYQELIEK